MIDIDTMIVTLCATIVIAIIDKYHRAHTKMTIGRFDWLDAAIDTKAEMLKKEQQAAAKARAELVAQEVSNITYQLIDYPTVPRMAWLEESAQQFKAGGLDVQKCSTHKIAALDMPSGQYKPYYWLIAVPSRKP